MEPAEVINLGPKPEIHHPVFTVNGPNLSPIQGVYLRSPEDQMRTDFNKMGYVYGNLHEIHSALKFYHAALTAGVIGPHDIPNSLGSFDVVVVDDNGQFHNCKMMDSSEILSQDTAQSSISSAVTGPMNSGCGVVQIPGHIPVLPTPINISTDFSCSGIADSTIAVPGIVADSAIPADGIPADTIPLSAVPVSAIPADGIPVDGIHAPRIPTNFAVPVTGIPTGSAVPATGIPTGSAVPATGIQDHLPVDSGLGICPVSVTPSQVPTIGSVHVAETHNHVSVPAKQKQKRQGGYTKRAWVPPTLTTKYSHTASTFEKYKLLISSIALQEPQVQVSNVKIIDILTTIGYTPQTSEVLVASFRTTLLRTRERNAFVGLGNHKFRTLTESPKTVNAFKRYASKILKKIM